MTALEHFYYYTKTAFIKSCKNKWFLIFILLSLVLATYKAIDQSLSGIYLIAAFCVPVTLLFRQMDKEIKDDDIKGKKYFK